MRIILLLTLCAAILSTSSGQTRDDVQGYKPSDAILNKAYADARNSAQSFISQLASPKSAYRYLVKIRIEADGHVEHVWVEPVRYQNGVFRGPIANAPLKIKALKEGSVVQAKPEELSDWVILDESGKIKSGGFTQKAMENHPGAKPK